MALLLSVIVLLMLASATPVLPNENGMGACVVAPTIKGDEIKEPVAGVPDKGAGHPVFGENPAYGGTYPGPGTSRKAGKVFWTLSGGG